MINTSYFPSAPLQPYISKYLFIQSKEELTNRILPDTSCVMALRYKGEVRHFVDGDMEKLPFAVLSGLRKKGRLINYARDSGNLLVIFREAGARALIREPLYQLFEESISLDSFERFRRISELEEQLSLATGNPERIAVVEKFLLLKLSPVPPDLLIRAAVEKIRALKGVVRIRELASTLCISLDAFEKRFRNHIGISPKQFSYIVRMRAVLSQGLQSDTLTQTALKAGYFDQSHFNKDFKTFTNQTPSDFLQSPVFW